jgi:hypothetical protein
MYYLDEEGNRVYTLSVRLCSVRSCIPSLYQAPPAECDGCTQDCFALLLASAEGRSQWQPNQVGTPSPFLSR